MATIIYVPNYKNSMPHGGAALVEDFVSRSIPGGEVEWAGNLGRSGRAGLGIAFGYAPSEAEREHAWNVARAVGDLLPRREVKTAPVNVKSRCLSLSEAEAAAQARWGGDQNMVPRLPSAE